MYILEVRLPNKTKFYSYYNKSQAKQICKDIQNCPEVKFCRVTNQNTGKVIFSFKKGGD